MGGETTLGVSLHCQPWPPLLFVVVMIGDGDDGSSRSGGNTSSDWGSSNS